MQKIYVLSEHVVSHIAAGEVIERPCYAVKELVENAIDAHANSIRIEIEESGLKQIVVTDNGEGMSPEDLEICFKPHTTSKIKTEHDLTGVQTLGFRGEALSSIAAICDIQIKSRDIEHKSGVMITLQQGRVIESVPVGMPVGTSITLDNLFYPVPARKKFLKSERTEYRLIVDIVSRLALANPTIHFYLSHNGKKVLDIPKQATVLERIAMLIGKPALSQLIPLNTEDSYIKLSGFISKPQLTTGSTAKHFISINKRHVSDTSISKAVKEAYGTLLDPHSQPIFFLAITIPHEVVDVNVHPRKEEVSFIDKNILYELIMKAVSTVLSQNNLLFQQVLQDRTKRSTQTFTGLLLKDEVSPWNVKDIGSIFGSEIIQIHNLYIIAPTKRGLLCIDQHAAHERILYEQFKETFEEKQKENQLYILEETVSLELSRVDAELLIEHYSLFEQLGFVIEHFRDATFLLRQVPLLFQDRDYRILILELLENLAEEKNLKTVDRFSDKILKYLACRAAIKAGDTLTQNECHELIKKLEVTRNNATCPHGRPTKVELPIRDFHKLFKRA